MQPSMRSHDRFSGCSRLSAATILLFFSVAGNAQEQGFDFDDMKLPPGFEATTYISASGFDNTVRDVERLAPSDQRDAPGLPSIVTITFGPQGNLFFGKTANRIQEITNEQSAPIYRIPAGPALDITQETEQELLFGPAIEDPDEVAVNREGYVFVSSTSRDVEWTGGGADVPTGIGAVYKISPTGDSELFAGGSKHPGLLQDPEAIAFDEAGNVYITDEDKGVVAMLDPEGNVINPRWISGYERWRQIVYDPRGFFWLGSDGRLDEPHDEKYGRVFRVEWQGGEMTLLDSGTLGAFKGVGPGGNLYMGSRRSGRIYVLSPEGERAIFATFNRDTGNAAMRVVAFPPETRATREKGIAGDLFVMAFPTLDYPVREIIRISGPFEEWAEQSTDLGEPTPPLQ